MTDQFLMKAELVTIIFVIECHMIDIIGVILRLGHDLYVSFVAFVIALRSDNSLMKC